MTVPKKYRGESGESGASGGLRYKTLLAGSDGFPRGLAANTTYVMTEKKDGVRATWDGQRLLARRGGDLKAPRELVDGLPVRRNDVELVGELCAQRGDSDRLRGLVRAGDERAAQTHEELQTKLFLFEDLAGQPGRTYRRRLSDMERMVERSGNPRLGTVKMLGEVKSSSGSSLGSPARSVISALGALGTKIRDVVSRQDEGVVLTPNLGGPSAGRIKVKNLKVGVATVLAASTTGGGGCTVEATLKKRSRGGAGAGKGVGTKGSHPVTFNVSKRRCKEIYRGANVEVYYREKKVNSRPGSKGTRIVDVMMV